MMYTDFVSTLNHKINKVGYAAMVSNVDVWFTPELWSNEMTAYAAGLLEYCCHKAGVKYPEAYEGWKDFRLPTMYYPEHVRIMQRVIGDEYVRQYEEACIDIFKRHNVCVMEVGNAI